MVDRNLGVSPLRFKHSDQIEILPQRGRALGTRFSFVVFELLTTKERAQTEPPSLTRTQM